MNCDYCQRAMNYSFYINDAYWVKVVGEDKFDLNAGRICAHCTLERLGGLGWLIMWNEQAEKMRANTEIMEPVEAAPMDREIEQTWNEFWRPVLYKDRNGSAALDMDAVKREMYDYHVMMREVSEVYDTLTRGRISKPNTSARAVINTVNGLNDLKTSEDHCMGCGKPMTGDQPYICSHECARQAAGALSDA